MHFHLNTSSIFNSHSYFICSCCEHLRWLFSSHNSLCECLVWRRVTQHSTQYDITRIHIFDLQATIYRLLLEFRTGQRGHLHWVHGTYVIRNTTEGELLPSRNERNSYLPWHKISVYGSWQFELDNWVVLLTGHASDIGSHVSGGVSCFWGSDSMHILLLL